MQLVPRDVIQIIDGPLRGLLAQVVEVEVDQIKCLSRDFDGTPRFFSVKDTGSFRLVGQAVLGPKSKDGSPAQAEATPSAPPAIDPQELLEPLPPEIKAVPMNQKAADAYLPPAPPPLPPTYKKGHRRIKKSRANPNPAPRPQVLRRPFIATVRNALGQEAAVEIGVRVDDDPTRHNGIAMMLASKKIQNLKPMTVTGWKLKE